MRQRKRMKVGDLIKLKPFAAPAIFSLCPTPMPFGIVTDILEDESGFYDCLILFPHGEEWLKDIQFEVISEAN